MTYYRLPAKFYPFMWTLSIAVGFTSLWICMHTIINKHKWLKYTPDNYLWFLYDGLIYFIPGAIMKITPLEYSIQANRYLGLVHIILGFWWTQYTFTTRDPIRLLNLIDALTFGMCLVHLTWTVFLAFIIFDIYYN